MTATTQANAARLREEWLATLAELFRPAIEDRAGVTFPSFRVTCGFPSRGGEMGGKTRVRGQCWSAEASDDRHAEIFISPVEDDAAQVAAILAHEMVHAALPNAGHGKPFQAAMRTLGHTAPFTSCNLTDAWAAWTAPLVAQVGPYPHAKLNAMRAVAAPKKQNARLLKATCGGEDGEACGYTVRVTRKWVVDLGAPCCPRHGPMTVEGLEDDEDLDPVPEGGED